MPELTGIGPGPEAASQRGAVRRGIRARRRQLGRRQRTDAETRITRLLISSHLFRRSRRIAFYWANDGEIDLARLIDRAWQSHKSCYLPVLSPLKADRLWFAPYTAATPLVLNRYDIPEPWTPHRRYTRAEELDLILTPLVAFDDLGNRLGMGGGYYDRSLGFLRHRRHWHRPRTIGIAYEFQKVDRLSPQPWDVPLDAVVTEAGIYTGFGRRKNDL